MKRKYLLRIVKEEVEKVLREADFGDDVVYDYTKPDAAAGATVAGDWPASERPPWAKEGDTTDPMGRARELAQQGVEQAQGEDLGVFDGTMDDGTPVVDVLNICQCALKGPCAAGKVSKFPHSRRFPNI